MKTIIAGGRTLRLSQMQYDFLNAIHRMTPITEVSPVGRQGQIPTGNDGHFKTKSRSSTSSLIGHTAKKQGR